MKALLKTLKWFIILLFLTATSASLGLLYLYIKTPIPDIDKDFNESTLIYDKEGELLDEVHGEEHRKVVPLSKIDKDLQNAVIAIEDERFYSHPGVDARGVMRAAVKNIKTKSTSEGASTITMQLAKNLFTSIDERTWANKIVETFYAFRLEQALTKDEILEMYLNKIYWGNNTYGIETAAETYFGKTAEDLEIHEAALLAAMIQNPSRFNIYSPNKDAAYAALKDRQKEVLTKMAKTYARCTSKTKEAKLLCKEEWANKQHGEKLLFTGKTTWQASKEGYTTDMAMEEAVKILGLDSIEDLKTGGYRIYSTIDRDHQTLAKAVINDYKGGKSNAQMALAAVDPRTNKVIVSIGGTDYNTSPLNRSLKTGGLRGRQPGSSIKSYIYYVAMGYWNPDSTLVDEPYCINMGRWAKPYCPKNYGGGHAGADTLENHLAKSRNIPAIKIGQYVGIKNVIKVMKDLGITTKLENVPSFPLGSNDLVVMEHANAYAAFANNGKQQFYTSIEKITDSKGNILHQYENNQTQKLDPTKVKKLNQMLRTTAVQGTSTAANTISDVHAKTGTTDSEKDVWCMAYTDKISTAMWIGHDDFHKKLYGATGGGWACPVTGSFLRKMQSKGYL